ncbi:MAG: hypothetical protein K2L16_02445 [Muribaculaceae bacterium]|nr:hypothetical protein [Muribaculaceae bacterium]
MKKENIKKGLSKVAGKARAVAQGDAVDSRFFKQHFFATAFAVITCLAFIAARFDHATTEAGIRSLNTQIDVARTHKQQELSRYHTLTRESAMRHLVDSLHLGLDVPEASPDARPGILTY